PNKKSIEVTTAFCRIPGCKVSYAFHRSITNLLDHLQKKHNITKESEYNKYIQQNSSEKKLIQQKLEHILIKPYDLKKQEKIIQKLLKLIVREELSLILIECKWFRKFVNYIDSRFKIPCINNDFELCETLLEIEEFKYEHTAERIAQFLEAAIEKWSIQNKVITMSTDNGSNIKAAFHHYLSHIINIPCVAHTLQLSVKQSIIAAKSLF
ncbi:9566_t:CDS:2, partial [Cetraspora pellucida]